MSQQVTRNHRPGVTAAETVRGLASLVLLILVVGGVPYLLLRLAGALPIHIRLHDLIGQLAGPDDGSLFLLAMLVVAWVGWAAFTISALAEIAALIRHLPAPRLPGLALTQNGAGALVASIAVLLSTGPALASAPPAQTVITASATPNPHAAREVSSPPVARKQPTVPLSTTGSNHYPTVTVQRHDTLWGLAETYLGAGERYHEIVRLNLDRIQPDGQRLRNADWITPGWVLRLPIDARDVPALGDVDHGVAAPNSSPEVTYVVRPGDTLWDIAEEHLGDGARYWQIYRRNRGVTQPDGGHLSNPAVIQAGWRLILPTDRTEPVKVTRAAPTPPVPDPAPATARHVSVPGSDVPASDVPQPAPASGHPPEEEPRLSPAAPTASSTTSAADVAAQDELPGEHELLSTLVFGLGAVTLTGLVAELARRRRRQQASRRPGQRIPMPEPADAKLEAVAAVNAVPVTTDTVRRALRALAAGCASSGRMLPDVRFIRIAPDQLELTLAATDTDAVAPFTSTGPDRWQLTGPIPEPTDPVPGSDPYPALVMIGAQDSAMVLVNLESIGALRLSGQTDQVQAVLRALALDLAVGPLSGGVDLTLAGDFATLARALDPGRVQLADTDRTARAVTVRLRFTDEQLTDAADIRAARSVDPTGDLSHPHVVLSDTRLPVDPEPWRGVSLIHPGEEQDDRWCLVLSSSGTARLEPAGIIVDPQSITEADYTRVVRLLATADIEPGRMPDLAPVVDLNDPETTAPRSVRLPPSPVATTTVPTRGDQAPRVQVLGKVEIDRAVEDAAPYRHRRLGELITYLALHPDATAQEIDEIMWPGKRIDYRNRNTLVSRARQWLGESPTGEFYLPFVLKGSRYHLHPDVTCDWYDFLELARRGLDGGPDGTADLQAALDLVRGRPFLGIEAKNYTWAEADTQQMIVSIVDVAHHLSTRLRDNGHPREALQAATRGLLAEPFSETLLQDALDAAHDTGDVQEEHRLINLRERTLEDDFAS